MGTQTGVFVGLAQGGSERLPRGDTEPEDAPLFPSSLGTLQNRLRFLEGSASCRWGEGPSRTQIRTRLEGGNDVKQTTWDAKVSWDLL